MNATMDGEDVLFRSRRGHGQGEGSRFHCGRINSAEKVVAFNVVLDGNHCAEGFRLSKDCPSDFCVLMYWSREGNNIHYRRLA
jgi:hypothetical protein